MSGGGAVVWEDLTPRVGRVARPVFPPDGRSKKLLDHLLLVRSDLFFGRREKEVVALTCRSLQPTSITRTSMTFVPVRPVRSRSPLASKKA